MRVETGIKKSVKSVPGKTLTAKVVKKPTSIFQPQKQHKSVKRTQLPALRKAIKRNEIYSKQNLKSYKNSFRKLKTGSNISTSGLSPSAKAIAATGKKVGSKIGKVESQIFNKPIDSNNTYDNGTDVARTIKKGADNIKDGAKSVKSIGSKVVKKHKKKIEKSTRKAARSTARTAKKATVRAAKATTKAGAKAAQKSIRAAKAAAKGAVKLTTQIVQKAVAVIKALASTPVGLIVLGVAAAVILLMVIISNMSNAAVSTVAAPLNSISWLWGGNDNMTAEELVEGLEYYENEITYYLDIAKSNTTNAMDEIEVDGYDMVYFNGAYYYPASTAWDSIKEQINDMEIVDEDFIHFLCVANVYKQKLKQIADGLPPEEIPEIAECILQNNDIAALLGVGTGTFEDMKPFLNAKVQTERSTNTCPGANCCVRYCEDDEDCPGHSYCDRSHLVITVNFHLIDNLPDYLLFTEGENGRLKLSEDMLTGLINSVETSAVTE